ncbi:MAG: trimethylamine corrinoid protein 2 [Firmicutes bacterium]|nr:trimethylamine corrinoid protein 2 [Bacillota bacterium]
MYKRDWGEAKERFIAWWNHSSIGRPMLRIIARRSHPMEPIEPVQPPKDPEALHLDPERLVKEMRNFCRTHIFMAEAFPSVDLNIGPGSMATYLGSEPNFAWDTVWYTPCVRENWRRHGPLKYDVDNHWWKRHVESVKRAKELADKDMLVNIPDIVENVDILAAMRGPQEFCFDLVDEPELVKDYIHQIDELYFRYYDVFYDIVADDDGSSSYTAFSIWGPGKTAKLQCDFSALMSPKQFREFVQPSLRKQCKRLDYSLYHLDGPDAIKHLDALMEIDELDALQWTPGAGKPDGGSELWYPIYDKAKSAGKSLWIGISDGTVEDWIEKATKLVNRYGSDGLYLLFPVMEETDAEALMSNFC